MMRQNVFQGSKDKEIVFTCGECGKEHRVGHNLCNYIDRLRKERDQLKADLSQRDKVIEVLRAELTSIHKIDIGAHWEYKVVLQNIIDSTGEALSTANKLQEGK